MKLIWIFILSLMSTTIWAQNQVDRSNGMNTLNDPRLKASKTFYIPRGLTPTLNGGLDSSGALFYRTSDTTLYFYDGTQWLKVGENLVLEHLINGLNGQVPYFTQDNKSTQSAGDILNIGKFVYTDAQLDSMEVTHIAQQKIFTTWDRFAHGGISGDGNASRLQNSDSIPNRVEAANSFLYEISTNLVKSTFNTGAHIGFINTNLSKNYQLSATVSSTANDNDLIGLVIAYVEDKDDLVKNNAYGLNPSDFTWNISTTSPVIPMQHTLTLYRGRHGGGTQYYVLYDAGLADEEIIANGSNLMSYQPLTGWDGISTETDLKAIRNGDTIRVYSTEYADAPGGKGSLSHEMTIVLTSNPLLEKFRNGSYFGIGCESQPFAYWKNFLFTDNTLNIYDLRNGNVYKYDNNGQYQLQQNESVWTDISIRRLWYNPFLETSGWITPDSNYYVINKLISVTSALLDFPNTLAQTSSNLTVTVDGATIGDPVNLSFEPTVMPSNGSYSAWVSAANTVTIRFNNYSASAINPTAGNFYLSINSKQ